MTLDRRSFGARPLMCLLVVGACVLSPTAAIAQGLTGSLIGTVRDANGGVISGAVVVLSSPALIGGPVTIQTDERGRFRFPVLPIGSYVLEINMPGFKMHRDPDIRIGAGATLETQVVLQLASFEDSVVVRAMGSRLEARHPGFGARITADDIQTIPSRRSSMFDPIRAAPGISPTSPSSGTVTTVSSFGSGINANMFLIDGTNMTCPCIGIARSEPGIDFIQEIQIQSVGTSAEYGNLQGAVINVITRQGSDQFLLDAASYWQPGGLTSQPVELEVGNPSVRSGYERDVYRDGTASAGGPVARGRLWFFAGYQHLRDSDSQPGTDPEFPRRYDQDKVIAKLTWRPAPGWQVFSSFHDELWVNQRAPTIDRPFETTLRASASVPAVTFGHVTHVLSDRTVWDARVGRFMYYEDNEPSTGILTISPRLDAVTRRQSGAPQIVPDVTLGRITAKATLSHYRPDLLGGDHEWKVGGQFERGEHHVIGLTPTGERFIDSNGRPSEKVTQAPAHIGGRFHTAAAFVSDTIALGERLTVSAGVRFEYNRAISQDLRAVDAAGRETDDIISGLGTMYRWYVWAPRLGATRKFGSAGRTILRASYGRFSQGVLTAELDPVHPGNTPATFTNLTSGAVSRVEDPRTNLQIDPDTRAPHTDEYSVGIDREITRGLTVTLVYVGKRGHDTIGWTDIAGKYREETRTLADGRILPVYPLHTAETPPDARRFLLTNQEAYSLTYNGLVVAVDRRRAGRWQASGSYTFSRAYGLQPSSAATAAGEQTNTVGILGTFGRDPNDLTNTRGRLPNDRPHAFRVMGAIDVPRTAFRFAGTLQYFSGKPWAATAIVALPQNRQQRILIEPRGTRRLPSQALLDLRLSRLIHSGRFGRIEVLLDMLNVLNDSAAEGIVSDVLTTETVERNSTFAVPNVFIDPRRVMIGVRLGLGRS